MTRQEAYETMRSYFSRPGAELSKRPLTGDEENDPGCYYRHPDDGRACAFGCLIPDDLYDPSMEARSVSAVLRESPDLTTALGIGTIDDNYLVNFLGEAQMAHDEDAVNAVHFVELLDTLAIDEGLEVVAA